MHLRPSPGLPIVSGQLISRTGRYQVFPVLASVFATAGRWLLHTVGVDTPFWHTGTFMAVFGLVYSSLGSAPYKEDTPHQ